jgi:hypothetical protein
VSGQRWALRSGVEISLTKADASLPISMRMPAAKSTMKMPIRMAMRVAMVRG